MTNFSGKNLDNAEDVGRKTEYQEDASQRGDLPEGWSRTTLGDFISISSGEGLVKSNMENGSVPVYGGNGITGWHNESNIREKTIVIGRVGFYCGSIHLTPKDAWVTDNAFITKFSKASINRMFLYRLLTSTNLRADDSGTAQPVISGRKVYPIEVWLAPLAEQQQIAQKLDELLAQVDTLKFRLDAIPKILKRFRQSVLAAAVSGRLTEEWRESVDLPTLKDKLKSEWVGYQLQLSSSKGKKLSSEALVRKYREPEFLPAPDEKLEKWITLSLKDLILEKNQGVNTTTEKVVYSSSGIPAIQAGNIGNRHIEYNSEKFISEEKFNELSDSVKPTLSDVLYTNIGANFGNAAVVKKNEIQFVITWNVLKIRPSKELNSDYLAIVLNTEKIRAEAWSSVSTSTVPFVNGKKVDEFQIPLPPLAEQTEIVRRVEQLFTYADQIEQRVKDAQKRVNHLTQSILAKAFRGELTAEWRAQNPALISGENSAAALLERIKAEREAAVKSKRKSKV